MFQHLNISLVWIIITVIAIILIVYLITIYYDISFCSQCYREAVWLTQRWIEKIFFISQEYPPHRASCISNLIQLSVAIKSYALNHDYKLPTCIDWKEKISGYIKNNQVFECPDAFMKQIRYYCMNPKLSGKKLKEISEPHKTILLFECDNNGMPVDRHHFLEFRHLCHVVFVNGHVERLPSKVVFRLIWSEK